MGTILLEGMEFFAFHGCFREEQIIGSRFLVDLTLETDCSAAEISDKLADTIDYSSVYRVVEYEINQKSQLLEHVAGRITQAVVKKFPGITNLRLKISKLNPPLGGRISSVGYEMGWRK